MALEASEIDPCYHLSNDTTSLILDCRHRLPALVYFGSRLDQFAADHLSLLDRDEAPASLPGVPPLALLPDGCSGFLGHPGIAVRRGESGWQIHPVLDSVQQTSSEQLVLNARCQSGAVGVQLRVALDPRLPVFSITVSISNQHALASLQVDECNVTLPVPDHLTHSSGFQGRWGLEFQWQTQPIGHSALVRENRCGRTSHRGPPHVTVHEKTVTENSGSAMACHLAWSGNHRTRVEQLADGRRYLQLGELLAPGEVDLDPGATYTSPTVWCAFSETGWGGLSDNWQQLARHRFASVAALQHRPRPVQFNTWEATYFDFDETALLELVERAADLGVERFVLDDGWFNGRHSDASSLGDWQVDRGKLPRGLGSIIDACSGHGMAFGLWIEPEMVSPDSALYRRHPDWVLHCDPAPRLLARQQLVLDLDQAEVREYLLAAITALLSDHDISYLKWDMNRDIHQAGNAAGQHAVHGQTRALYGLLAEIRQRFPDVEIESCASGGGRVDFGILPYVSRFWTSDSNDALDRLGIQRGFSQILPPELMGCHIGPAVCHTTGRQHALEFRAGVAFWGHLGIEMDPRQLSPDEAHTLTSIVALHKRHRSLLHGGRTLQLQRPDGEMAWGVVDPTGEQGLFAAARCHSTVDVFPRRYRFRGLDPTADYNLSLIWPDATAPALQQHADAIGIRAVSGAVLMQIGIELPIMAPETLLIYHLQRAQDAAAGH